MSTVQKNRKNSKVVASYNQMVTNHVGPRRKERMKKPHNRCTENEDQLGECIQSKRTTKELVHKENTKRKTL